MEYKIDLTRERLANYAIAAATLTALAMPLAIIAAAVYLDDGRPIVYSQSRSGKDGAHFGILKFRSMRDVEGGDVERLTRIGRFLRKNHFDELLQFWNVVKGEMNIIGWRPLRDIPENVPKDHKESPCRA